ncbi:MAG TPA: DAK2 domain-containing protein [Syntrophomonadaceae bacterium]|nr:DAK2 domain-containing protein [Syntrophomonadaceae bacterium]
MGLKLINGTDWVRSVKAGCIKLEHNRDRVDLLNVFPVPDGDTGTNMYLTLLSAVKEAENNIDKPLGKIAKAISMGSLMGARGNSGVIMSQIFRGMANILGDKEQATSMDIALALKAGSDTAYKAIMKPVEGTILTVIRETADACENEAKKEEDIVECLLVGIRKGYAILELTPTMLPVLKEAGVVDAGGQGLLYFLEGIVEGLARENDIELGTYEGSVIDRSEHTTKQDLTIEFQYCTELLIKGTNHIDLEDIKDHISPLGDSMLVVGDEDIVKIHIHSNHPGKVLESCLQWGELTDIKIDNMLEEVHEHLDNRDQIEIAPAVFKKIGLVAVGVGDGIVEILKSLGVDIVVEGGQTMNPSTEDLLTACNSVQSETIIILPNNSNIVLAAEQVKSLTDKEILVVPTKSVMQAITALIAFDPEGDLQEVFQAMSDEINNVKYAEITHAVRDSSINGLKIKDGDIIGIILGQISLIADNNEDGLLKVIDAMLDEDSELITFFYGDEVSKEEAEIAKEKVTAKFTECEIEVHYGGQPHYSYWVAVE